MLRLNISYSALKLTEVWLCPSDLFARKELYILRLLKSKGLILPARSCWFISDRWRNQIEHLAFPCKWHILLTLEQPITSCLITEPDLLGKQRHVLREASFRKVSGRAKSAQIRVMQTSEDLAFPTGPVSSDLCSSFAPIPCKKTDGRPQFQMLFRPAGSCQ